jgi:hypothetical protein
MAKMKKEFKLALENFNDKNKITYEPILLFGIEDLVLLLKKEQDIEDEETILTHLANRLKLNIVKITPNVARKLAIPKLMPFLNQDFSEKSLIFGLETLIKYNSNLEYYIDFLKKLSNYKNIFTEIARVIK